MELDKIKQSEQKTIELVGDTWNYVKERLSTNVRVYKSLDGSKYLRIGETRSIKSEVTYIKKIYGLEFPVPKVLEQGEVSGYSYYIESSVGETPFGDKFREECTSQGRVSQDSLESFCEVVCAFLRAQIKSSSLNMQVDLRKDIMLSNVLQENPCLDISQVESCIKKIESRLSGLPKNFSHGDLTPRNVSEKGVIDFEFCSIAPIGFDVLTAPLIERFWGFSANDKKTHEEFYLDKKQVSYYFHKVEKEAELHGIRGFLQFTDDFILLKAIWSLAHEKSQAEQSGDTTKWGFRKKVLVYCMECYLIGESIKTEKFKRLN